MNKFLIVLVCLLVLIGCTPKRESIKIGAKKSDNEAVKQSPEKTSFTIDQYENNFDESRNIVTVKVKFRMNNLPSDIEGVTARILLCGSGTDFYSKTIQINGLQNEYSLTHSFELKKLSEPVVPTAPIRLAVYDKYNMEIYGAVLE